MHICPPAFAKVRCKTTETVAWHCVWLLAVLEADGLNTPVAEKEQH